MNIHRIEEVNIAEKKVLVRADLDVSKKDEDVFRLKALIPTWEYLRDNNCEIVLIGHKGRPLGKEIKEYSLLPVSKRLEELLLQEWGEGKMMGEGAKKRGHVRITAPYHFISKVDSLRVPGFLRGQVKCLKQ